MPGSDEEDDDGTDGADVAVVGDIVVVDVVDDSYEDRPARKTVAKRPSIYVPGRVRRAGAGC